MRDRLTVGRRTLNPLIMVRIHVPQQATEGERSAQRQQAAGALPQVRNRFANANLFP